MEIVGNTLFNNDRIYFNDQVLINCNRVSKEQFEFKQPSAKCENYKRPYL